MGREQGIRLKYRRSAHSCRPRSHPVHSTAVPSRTRHGPLGSILMSETTSEPTRRMRAPRARKSLATPPPAIPPLTDRLAQRVVIEHVRPEIDGGRFPIKRAPGERVVVTAAIHADGHDVLAASLWHRHVAHSSEGASPLPSARFDAAAGWRESTMIPLGNDEWVGAFTIGEVGTAEYTVEGWVDTFASWRKGLAAKVQAGQ